MTTGSIVYRSDGAAIDYGPGGRQLWVSDGSGRTGPERTRARADSRSAACKSRPQPQPGGNRGAGFRHRRAHAGSAEANARPRAEHHRPRWGPPGRICAGDADRVPVLSTDPRADVRPVGSAENAAAALLCNGADLRRKALAGTGDFRSALPFPPVSPPDEVRLLGDRGLDPQHALNARASAHRIRGDRSLSR